MPDSLRPHGLQPTRLRSPWDSPGKNTGVGCHFLLQCMKVKSESEVAQSCPTLSDPMNCSLPGSSVHGIFQARVLEWVAIALSEEQCYSMLNPGLSLLCVPRLSSFLSHGSPQSSAELSHDISNVGTFDRLRLGYVLGLLLLSRFSHVQLCATP